MNLVFGHDDTVNQWIEMRHGVAVVQTPSVSIGVINNDGVLRGAFVTTWKNDTTAELHLYGKTSNDTWKRYFSWVFEHCHRLEVRTSKKNRTIKRAAPKFGFKFQGAEPDFYGPDRHALVYYMTPAHCRWIKADGLTLLDA